jgi:hypothetical protein
MGTHAPTGQFAFVQKPFYFGLGQRQQLARVRYGKNFFFHG